MGNTLGIDYDFDHAEQESDRGLEITWNGKTYPAIVSVPTEAREYEEDGSGYFVSRNIVATVRKSVMGSAIPVGDKVTYDGTVYRVADIGSDTEQAAHILTCKGKAS
jgi:hypothetical protein